MTEYFKFCPKCAKPLPEKKAANLINCKKCGFHYYLNTCPTAGAILENKNGEILLVERKVKPKKGFWDIPGGYVEFNETFERAIARELKEELGTDGSDLTYIGSSTDIYPYKGIIYNTVVAVFRGKIGGKIYPGDDVASFKFFDKKNFPKNKFAFPGLAKLIENFIFEE